MPAVDHASLLVLFLSLLASLWPLFDACGICSSVLSELRRGPTPVAPWETESPLSDSEAERSEDDEDEAARDLLAPCDQDVHELLGSGLIDHAPSAMDRPPSHRAETEPRPPRS